MPFIRLWVLVEENFSAIPVAMQSTNFSFPPMHFSPNLEPVSSQRMGGGTVGEDLCGLNSHLLPSLPPLPKAVTQERSFSSNLGYELTQRRDVCGRLSSSSTDGIRQLLPLCSHRLHSLHLFPFSASNNLGGGGGFKKCFINASGNVVLCVNCRNYLQ